MISDAAKATARVAIERTFDTARFVKLERTLEKGAFGSSEVFTESGVPFDGRVGAVSLQERLTVAGEERGDLYWLICPINTDLGDDDHVKDIARARMYKVIGCYALEPGACTRRFMVSDVGAAALEESEDDD